ncbi:MAG: glycosyltransferase family 4 protein, partial [Anaerolineae bacterium]
RYGHVEGVHVRGAVSHEEKLAALRACDCLALPSTAEAFGIVFLESWIMGRPVIGARTGAVSSVITEGEDGLLAAPGDVASLAACIARLARDPDRARQMGARGRKTVLRRYTVARIGDRVEAAAGRRPTIVRVHVVGPDSLAQRFREREHAVSCGQPVPADADLYLFAGGDEALKHLERGLVALDLRLTPATALGGAAAAWPSYADLCLVGDAAARAALVEAAGCEPERVFVATDEAAVVDLAERALRGDLPPAAGEAPAQGTAADPAMPAGGDLAELLARLDALERQADVMQRGYEVRSRLPLIGPLVAWLRRNLTSHLREPYLDPTLERQVRLNRELVALLRELVRRQAALDSRTEDKGD